MVSGVHRRAQVRAQQLGQLPGVVAVGLDAVAGPLRDQRRRDHLALDAFGLELALQREAARTGLVAGHDRPRRHALQALCEPLHRAQLVCQLPLLGPLGPGASTATRIVAACASIPAYMVVTFPTGSLSYAATQPSRL